LIAVWSFRHNTGLVIGARISTWLKRSEHTALALTLGVFISR